MDSEMPPVLPPASPPASPVPRKSRTWLVIVLGLIGAALLGVLMVVGSGALFVLTAKEQPLSAKDAPKFSLIMSEGAPVGMVFSARKEKRVFLISISGVYFEDSESIEDLLEGHLRALEQLPAP